MKNNVIEPIAAEGMGTATQEGDITMTTPVYTFRRLNSTDMFLMFKIIGKIGINEFTKAFGKDAIQDMMASLGVGKGKNDMTTLMGISVILEISNIVLGNIHKCENDIYQILAQTSNLTVDDVRGLDIATFTGMVIDFIKKEEFKDFIKVVSRSFKVTN